METKVLFMLTRDVVVYLCVEGTQPLSVASVCGLLKYSLKKPGAINKYTMNKSKILTIHTIMGSHEQCSKTDFYDPTASSRFSSKIALFLSIHTCMDLKTTALAGEQWRGAIFLQQRVGGSWGTVLLPKGKADLWD